MNKEFTQEDLEEAARKANKEQADYMKDAKKEPEMSAILAVAAAKAEILEVCEKMRVKVCGCDEDSEGFGYHTDNCDFMPYGYNQALDDVIKEIEASASPLEK